MAKAQPSDTSNEHTFETAMQRLEQIVQTMDSDELPLEDLIVRYEEGIQLVQVCEAKLKSAEKKIEMIARKAQGPGELVEFAPGEPPAEKPVTPTREKDVRLF
jgi:exodeoxyribonuclease VII small subunit